MSELRLRALPFYMRAPIVAFIIIGVVGYAAGLAFVAYNTGMNSTGIADHYHGNEEELKFGKSTAAMLETVHTHLLGMGVLFFAVAILFTLSDASPRGKAIWATETLLTLLTTFGPLWLVAVGHRWAVWIIYPSSALMLCGYFYMSGTVVWNCITPDRSRSQ